MEKEKIIHDLAIAYAKIKVSELQRDKRENFGYGNTDMSVDEVLLLKSAYDFATMNLS